MTAEQQAPSSPPVWERFDPDVRVAALGLLGNARGEYLAGAADRVIEWVASDRLSEILQFLAAFGYEALRQAHGDDLAVRYLGDELEIAEAGQVLENMSADKIVAEFWGATPACPRPRLHGGVEES